MMITLRNIRKFSNISCKTTPLFSAPNTSMCKTKSPQLIISRNASIHTRNFFIQKLKLEHINNWGVALLTFPISCFALGIWQVKRRIWKENLIADLKKQMDKEPIDLPDDLTELKTKEYQAVRLRGEFLHDQEMYIGPRSFIEQEANNMRRGAFGNTPKSGYLVVTPFKLEGREETVLVNRGWIPRPHLKRETRANGQVKGTVEITGVVRKHENRPQFMPKSEGKNFLYRDVYRMCSLTGADPYFFDVTHQSTLPGGPIGGQTTVSIRNEHLSYIFTWFSLSGISGYFWYKIVYLVPK